MLSEAKYLSKKEAAQFRRALTNWYRKHERDLPWRHTRDPYAIFISEVMLQQTQVATVIPYYERWLRRFPNVGVLARASQAHVLRAWEGLGYYSRARNIQRTAKIVQEKFRGNFPDQIENLIGLPGIGRYTAHAIATFSFERSVPIVEANTARLLSRLFDLRLPIDENCGRAMLWQLAASLLPKNNSHAHNSALIDLGAKVCIAHSPRCPACPVQRFCRARDPAILPLKKQRPSEKKLTEFHSFNARDGQILLEQSRERWSGLWILPRLTRRPRDHAAICQLQFTFTHHRIALQVFDAPAPRRDWQRWFHFRELTRIPMPTPHRRALSQLLSRA